MSGISGMVMPRGSGATATAARVARMQEQMRHRGSGSTDVWTGPGVTLGHQRNKSLDGPGTRQPTLCPVSGCRLVMDGQVQAPFLTHRGAARSDESQRRDCTPEAVAGLFGRGGTGAIAGLTGTFAFAAWQEGERRLTLARDPLGLKPLYYVHAPDGSLFFASEAKALLAAGAVQAALNYRALSQYLATQTTPGEETLFAGVRRVPPGHALTWQDGRMSLHPYRPHHSEGEGNGRERDMVDRFGALFREAVAYGLRPDQAPGALLSASVGSATMLSVLTELTYTRVKTFSVAFTQQGTEELALTQRVADVYGTDHRELVLTEHDFFNSLPTAIWHHDEPIAHPSRIALYHAAALAAAELSEVWSAAGCDELLGGHPRHRRGLAVARLGRVWSRLPMATRLGRLLPAESRDAREAYLDALAVFGRADQRSLLTDGARKQVGEVGPYHTLLESMSGNGARPLTDELLALDLGVWLPELTTTQDRIAMAVSVQSHVPFLNHELVEFIAGLPARMKLRRGTPHHILRQELGADLPAELVRRRPARHQIPVGRWLRGSFRPLLHEYVLSDRALGRNIMRPDAVGHLVAEHESGRGDHTRQLWSLINLEIWQRLYLDGEAAALLSTDATAAAV
jgi:asparagine synthase (glutamine-hydrolysing)